MAVITGTATTATSKVLREDLSKVAELIAPTETPFLSAVGKGTAKAINHEWVVVDLQPATDANQVAEGESDVPNDNVNEGIRLGNYVMLSDKVVTISSTRQAVDEVGDLGSMAKQIAFKLKELRLDQEKHALGNRYAVGTGTRVAASVASFVQSNVDRGVGGGNPTLSGGTFGHPSAAAVDGELRAITEDMLAGVLQSVWEEGGDVSHVFCGAKNKRAISGFTGNATTFRESADKKLSTAIDIYCGDFGEVTIVPSRLIRSRDVLVLDPSKVSIDYLVPVKQVELAKTGHADRRLISTEYTISVANEKALGIIADLS
jgi:hypothetical protein